MTGLGATAAAQPCQLYRVHRPKVVRTEHHHTHPQYLQLRLWGEVRDGADLFVCSNCHDALHEAIGWLLGESRRPDPMPGRKVMRSAEATVAWYRTARKT